MYKHQNIQNAVDSSIRKSDANYRSSKVGFSQHRSCDKYLTLKLLKLL